jgi:hypothetical protein
MNLRAITFASLSLLILGCSSPVAAPKTAGEMLKRLNSKLDSAHWKNFEVEDNELPSEVSPSIKHRFCIINATWFSDTQEYSCELHHRYEQPKEYDCFVSEKGTVLVRGHIKNGEFSQWNWEGPNTNPEKLSETIIRTIVASLN